MMSLVVWLSFLEGTLIYLGGILCLAYIASTTGEVKEQRTKAVSGQYTGTALEEALRAQRFAFRLGGYLCIAILAVGMVLALVVLADPIVLHDLTLASLPGSLFYLHKNVTRPFVYSPRVPR